MRILLAVCGMALSAAHPCRAAVGDACVPCHPDEVSGYLQTGMGRSISRTAELGAASFDHEFSASSFAIRVTESGIVQSVERGGFAAEYPIDYVIGSGNAAFGFLVRVGSYVYQSPVSYYAKRKRWDMAPGFERHPSPDFDRPVLHECLWCHAGRPSPVPHTQNRYAEPVLQAEVISCDRCHGPAQAHLARPSAETIINPVRLPPDERDSVCEQCHLAGEERVLNPGMNFGDFRPGMRLEDAFSVYVSDFGTERPDQFKVVSHFEQLALSQCYKQSGSRMWCGTCHSPHERPENPSGHYRSRCLECHGTGLADQHAKPEESCVDCHMVRRPSFDSGHSAFTDHLISRAPAETTEAVVTASRLRPWREPHGPALAQRNLGLAYVRLGRRRQLAGFLDEGASLLARLVQDGSLDAVGLEALGSALLSKNAPPGSGLSELGAELVNQALADAPDIPAHYRTAAASEWQAGDPAKAIDLLGQAIRLDPQNRTAYQVLARIHEESSRRREAIGAWERYLQLVPQSIFARAAVRDLEIAAGPGGP